MKLNRMALDWTEKYRPKGLDEVLGNKSAVHELKEWALAWENGNADKKAVILAGDPGIGKTSAAHALAYDFGWGVIELNASDARNADVIKRVATTGAVNETFTENGEFISSKTGGRKLIILDEADNVFGQEDLGGMQQILYTIQETKQPIILIANDYYALTKKAPALKNMCQTIRFSHVQQNVLKNALRRICNSEGLDVRDDALDKIAERANGDIRSAINDLQALAEGKERIVSEDIDALGYRDPRTKMYDAMKIIFESRNVYKAKEMLAGLDEEPDFILLWVDENIPYAYRNPEDLLKGINALSKADIFLSRVKRRQYYGFWSYALDMMTSGVMMAKRKDSYIRGARYNFPSWLMHMKETKENRRILDSALGKISRYCHTSKNQARESILPAFKELFKRDFKFAVKMTVEMELEKDDVAFLIGEKNDSKEVKAILDEAEKIYEKLGKREIQIAGLEGAGLDNAGLNKGMDTGLDKGLGKSIEPDTTTNKKVEAKSEEELASQENTKIKKGKKTDLDNLGKDIEKKKRKEKKGLDTGPEKKSDEKSSPVKKDFKETKRTLHDKTEKEEIDDVDELVKEHIEDLHSVKKDAKIEKTAENQDGKDIKKQKSLFEF
ncbi:MAG: replication factor C large subunit [Thermoplasmata archaeon]